MTSSIQTSPRRPAAIQLLALALLATAPAQGRAETADLRCSPFATRALYLSTATADGGEVRATLWGAGLDRIRDGGSFALDRVMSPAGTGITLFCPPPGNQRCFPVESSLQMRPTAGQPGDRLEGVLNYLEPWATGHARGWQHIRFAAQLANNARQCP